MSDLVTLLEEAHQTAGRIQRPEHRGNTLISIAEVYLEAGQKSEGLAILAETLKAAGALKYPDEKAKQIAWMARLYSESGDTAQARELFTRARLLSRAAETPDRQAEALYSLACEYADAGMNEDAAKTLSELDKLAVDPQNLLDVACLLLDIAGLYIDLGQADKARELLEDILEISTARRDNWFKTERTIEAAELYAEIGDREKVARILESISPSLEMIEEDNRTGLLLRMSDIYSAAGNQAEAGDMLAKVVEIISRHPDNPSSPRDSLEVARVYLQLGNQETAAKVLKLAESAIDRIADPKEKVSALVSLAASLDRSAQKERSLEIASQALVLSGSIEDKKSLPFLLGSIAVLYVQLKEPEKAAETVSTIVLMLEGNPLKTSGLGAIVSDLAAAGEQALALKLAELIREPDVKAGALISIAQKRSLD